MKASLTVTFNKTISLIDRSTKWRAVGMLMIMLTGVLIETISIGLLFPFIKFLIAPDESTILTNYFQYLPFHIDGTGKSALIVLSAAILILFIVKNLLLLAIYFIQARFSLENMRLLKLRMYSQYLKGPYSLHLVRNSSDLIQNIHAAVNGVFVGSFMGFLTLASELLLIFALVVLLIFIDPITTLGAGFILIVCVGVYYFAAHRRFEYWGERTLKVEKSILKTLQQGFHNIKEIKVLRREQFALNAFNQPLLEYVRLICVKQVFVQAPRLWIETVTVVTITGVILWALIAGQTAANILPVLIIFAAATLRMIPSMNRLLVALNRINDAKHSVDVIHADVKFLEQNIFDNSDDLANIHFENEVSAQNLTFSYSTIDAVALDNVSFSLKKGQSLGIVGSSGAGKSTLVDIILGLLIPTSGTVLVDGFDVSKCTRAWQKHIGYVPQSIYLTDDTLRSNIALGVDDKDIDEAKLRTAIQLSHLDAFINLLPDGVNTVVNEHGVRLSGGQRQRVGIARALYHDPDILIFDEATSALDNETEHEVSSAIESLSGQKTIILIAHRFSTVRKCDQLIFMKDGRIEASGSFEDLTNKNINFKNLVQLSKL